MSYSDQEVIQRILRTAKHVAVVGLTDDPTRPSHFVPAYLQANGYHIIPINPTLSGTVLGETVYASLADAPGPIDVVQIFRRSDEVGPIVEQAIAAGAKAVWMQLGISNEEAAAVAHAAGLDVVMNQCMKVQHSRLSGETLI
ncbi:MAG: CoA-binding protein [Candidatus Promineofilum sp.]|nr:CoA-binding protein [Promineifilum sp.]MCW5864854.1 CoA-binding protein [Anaerolineae bacterium]